MEDGRDELGGYMSTSHGSDLNQGQEANLRPNHGGQSGQSLRWNHDVTPLVSSLQVEDLDRNLPNSGSPQPLLEPLSENFYAVLF